MGPGSEAGSSPALCSDLGYWEMSRETGRYASWAEPVILSLSYGVEREKRVLVGNISQC